MNTIKESLKTTLTSLIVLSLISIAYAWTEPTSNPPSGNVSAPINTSGTGQTKTGSLEVNGFWNRGTTALDGKVGIGTTGPDSKLHVIGSICAESSDTGCNPTSGYVRGSNLCIGTDCRSSWPSGTSGSGTSNYLTQWTGSSSLGNSKIALSDSAGSFGVEARYGQTGSAYSYIDFRGDDYYTDYGLRLLRGNGGRNTWSDLAHRGTGTLYLTAQDAGSISLRTNSADRLIINSSGNVKVTEGMDVGNASEAYSYITMRDNESPNGVKYVHANSNNIGFLSGAGSWIARWDDSGNLVQEGSLDIKDPTTGARVYWTAVNGNYGGDSVGGSTYRCYDTGSHNGSCSGIADSSTVTPNNADTQGSCPESASGSYTDYFSANSSSCDYSGDTSIGYHCSRTLTCKKEYQMTPTYVNANL